MRDLKIDFTNNLCEMNLVELYRAVQFSISEQLLGRNVERFRGGLVFEAHRLLYYSTLGTRVIKKKKNLPPAKSANTEKKGV